jgi:hypothetical protein
MRSVSPTVKTCRNGWYLQSLQRDPVALVDGCEACFTPVEGMPLTIAFLTVNAAVPAHLNE